MWLECGRDGVGVRPRRDVGVDAPGRASHFLARCLVGIAMVKSLNGQLDE